jgi:hypothetical protein
MSDGDMAEVVKAPCWSRSSLVWSAMVPGPLFADPDQSELRCRIRGDRNVGCARNLCRALKRCFPVGGLPQHSSL